MPLPTPHEPPPASPPDTAESAPLPALPARQLALQGAAVILVLSLAWPWFGTRGEPLPWPETAFAIGGAALLFASLGRQPWWWRLIHAGFAPLAWAVAQLPLDPGWFLAVFILLLLVYRGTLSGQAPLFLSNRETAAALARLTADRPGMRFADLGAGVGSVVLALAGERPDARFTGVENAPLVWAAGRLRSGARSNCEWRWGNLWDTDLAAFDVVYAFLSPAPMADLWQKVESEMRPGTLFVSNSFAVPGIEPTSLLEVADSRRTRLYCYQR